MLSFLTGRRRSPQTVREVLEGLGLSEEEIARAEADGTDEMLAIDRVVLPEPVEFTIGELAEAVGIETAVVRSYWRAMGFADVPEDEAAFSRRDLEIMRAFTDLARADVVDADDALRMSRVLGLSMAGVATAVVDAADARSAERRELVADGDAEALARHEAESLAVRAGDLLPFMSEVIDYAFRRHLRAASRRRIVSATQFSGEGQVVGFVDLVRFTALSQQLDEGALARLIERFDSLTNDIVVSHRGRIVKMIGDEAMFTVLDPVKGARMALDLAQTFADDPSLSDVRVGLANGPVLTRDGDLYGPVVNLASRLVETGRAGSTVVSQSMRDALAGNPEFSVRSSGSKRLRHIGTVRTYRLKPGPEWSPGVGSATSVA